MSVGSGQRTRSDASVTAHWTVPRLLALPVFAGVCVFVAWRWGLPGAVWLGYLGFSVATFVAYALDKSAAVQGRWRTPERTLHLLALAGGWPGALLAQQLLRHKTRKAAFIRVFWVTVGLNVAGLVAWRAGLV